MAMHNSARFSSGFFGEVFRISYLWDIGNIVLDLFKVSFYFLPW